MIALTKKCAECGRVFPMSEYITKYRNRTPTYAVCKECKGKLYSKEYTKKQAPQAWEIKF